MQIDWYLNSCECEQYLVHEFLSKQPGHSFFQSQSFIEFYQKNNFDVINLVGIFNDKVVSYCNVLVLKEKYSILSGLTSRAIIWGGPIVENDLFFEQTLLKLKNILRNKAIYLQIRNIFPLNNSRNQLLFKHGIIYNEHYTILNQLNPDLILNYHSGRRKNIRRALKNGLTFNCIDDANEIEKAGNLVIETYKEIKLPCPKIEFFKQAILFEDIKIFGVYHESKMISSRFCLTWGDYIYDWYAGSDKTSSSFYPNDLIVHSILEWGYENGFKTFDFGGAGNSKSEYGVRDFKLKFGGELIEFGRNELIFHPLKYKLGKLGFQILKIFSK